MINKLVEIGRELELNLEEQDFHELLECHTKELTNEDLMELEAHRKEDEVSEEEQEAEPPKTFVAKQLTECFGMIEKALAGFEAQYASIERFRKVHDAIACYRLIYDEKKASVQTSLDDYLKKAEKIDKPVPSTSTTDAKSEPQIIG